MAFRTYDLNQRIKITVFTCVMAALLSIGTKAQDLLEFWDASDSSNVETVDHSSWQHILDSHLKVHESGVNRFDYQALKDSDEDRKELGSYLIGLTQMDPRAFNKNVQMAYWINLYNALTVHVVTNNYPVDSIKDIKSGIINFGPWDRELITMQDQPLTLNDIEHRILRPIWKDPRIHYAVNCASIGCPNLATKVYTAENLESQLEQGAKDYINHPRGVSIEDGSLTISSIFDWYEEDFGGNSEGVLEHIAKYAEPALQDQLQGIDGYDDYYDWNLNQP